MAAWSDLVSVALLGTERRELPTDLPEDLASLGGRLTGDDAAGRLLDLAAGYAAYAKAGAVAVTAPAPATPPPIGDDPAPARAQVVLRGLLASREIALVSEWLRRCVEHGRSVPPVLWSGIADLTVTSTAVDRTLLRTALGERGVWFLAHNERWASLVGAGTPPTGSTDATEPGTTETSSPGAADPQGASAEEGLRETRRRDRDEARGILDQAWGRARADHKVAMLRDLEPDLAEDDEPALVRALRDRSSEVRETAATLISRLPGCGYTRRMTDRATACVSLTRSLGRWKIAVTPPEADASMTQDGVSEKPPRTFPGGPAAFVLRQIVGATDLAVWTADTRLTPADVLEVAARSAPEWLADLRDGWVQAAVRQADRGWALALVSAGEVDERLLPLVPASGLVTVATRWVQRGAGLEGLAQLVAQCSSPWPPDLAAVGLRLLSSGGLGSGTRRFADVVGHALSLEAYPLLEEHVLGWVPAKGTAPQVATQVRVALARVEELLATRISIRDAFDDRPTTIRRFDVPHL